MLSYNSLVCKYKQMFASHTLEFREKYFISKREEKDK